MDLHLFLFLLLFLVPVVVVVIVSSSSSSLPSFPPFLLLDLFSVEDGTEDPPCRHTFSTDTPMMQRVQGSEGGREGRRGVREHDDDDRWSSYPVPPPAFVLVLLWFQNAPVNVEVHVAGGDGENAFVFKVVDPVVVIKDADAVAVVVLPVYFCCVYLCVFFRLFIENISLRSEQIDESVKK